MAPGRGYSGDSAMPEVTKTGQALAPVAGQDQAINVQGTSS